MPTRTRTFGRAAARMLAAGILLLCAMLGWAEADPAVAATASGVRTERLIVGFAPGTSPAAAASRLRSAGVPTAREAAIARSDVPQLGAAVVTVPAGDVGTIRRELLSRADVRWVEVDHVAHATWNPGDPRLPEQWGIGKIGAPTAWNTARGAGVKIAVVDTGVGYIHQELYGRVEKGWDFVDEDSDPLDVQGHGTHVAGIAAGSAGNSAGGAGVAPSARILAVRALDGDGAGYYSWIAGAITWSTDHGAKVINLSLGGPEPAQVLQEAIGYAAARGVIVTCATGNDGAASVGYPARYADCLAVGASNSSDQRAEFSNYGSGIDVVAPGEGILSSTQDGYYDSWDGTSMATPFVSGLAALLLSQGMTARQVNAIIRSSAKNLGPAGWDSATGSGRIDVAAAVALASTSAVAPADITLPMATRATVGAAWTATSSRTTSSWKTMRTTRWRVIGESSFQGRWGWKKVKATSRVRRIYHFRMNHGIVKRRIITQRRRAVVHRTSTRYRSVTIAGTDNRGIDRVSLSVDGHHVGTDWTSSDGWSVPWVCTAGAHTFEGRVHDARDNSAATTVRTTVTC